MTDEQPEISASPIHPLLAAVLSKGTQVHTDADAINEALVLDDLESLRQILERGAEKENVLNPTDSVLWTPLEVAARRGNREAMQLLLAPGAVVSCHSRYCGGPLFAAIEDGQEEAVDFLLEHGADMHARDESGWTTLISAIWWSGEARHMDRFAGAAYRAVVQKLIAAGTDIEARAEVALSQRSPLQVAVSNSCPDPEMVKLLIAHGVDVHASDAQGWTAYRLAQRHVEALIEKGYEPGLERVEVLRILEAYLPKP
ncbi:MAG TPA: ankyrin repeat domain-containing protein [Chthonomonadaceae bacterium]|nr:ankyrin repeat domain-containing protein [Chthonomonadaceae bacterium]